MKRTVAALLALLAVTPPAVAEEDASALYARGRTILAGATQDTHRADGAALIARAAALGHPPAQYHLGFLYGEGRGVPRDPRKALLWFRTAADQGHMEAQYAVGLALSRLPDKREAADWFRRAAEQGMVDAQFQLALLHETGDGIAADEREARRWYKAAADKKDPAAMFNLALMLDQGRGGPSDLQSAVGLYIQAAQAALPEAQHALCELLLDGRGAAQNFANAAAWCLAAAQQGYAPAQLLLATFYALGRGVEPDEARAAAWLTVAADQDYPPAVKARDDLIPRLSDAVRRRAKEIVAELRLYERDGARIPVR